MIDRTGRYFRDINSLAQWLESSENSFSLVSSPEHGEAAQKQYNRANQLKDGDILLSYIKGVCTWAGVLLIQTDKTKGHIQPLNPVETEDSWSTSFGYALDIVPLFQLLNPEQCFLTSNSRLGLRYQGRGIYTQMQQIEDCQLIESNIEKASKQSTSSIRDSADTNTIHQLEDFCRNWQQTRQRDPYLNKKAISRSGGKCSICGITANEWIDKVSNAQPNHDYNNVFDNAKYSYNFFDVHHELTIANDSGDARIDNLRVLCPNCHRVVQRNLDAKRKDKNQNIN